VSKTALDPVFTLLRVVRRRDRMVAAVRHAKLIALPAGLALGAAAIAAVRLLDAPPQALWLPVAPMACVLAWSLFHDRELRPVARRLDDHYRLHDRIGNGIELLEQTINARLNSNDGSAHGLGKDPRSLALAHLAIEEALTCAEGLDPAKIAPLRVPVPRAIDAVAATLFCAALFVPRLNHPTKISHQPATIPAAPSTEMMISAKTSPNMVDAEPLRENLRDLGTHDDIAAKTTNELLDVLAALENGTLATAAALHRLNELDRALAKAQDQLESSAHEDSGLMSEAMRRAAEQLRQHEIMRDLSDALADREGDQAEEALNRAIRRGEAEGDDAQRDLDRALRALEKALSGSSATTAGTKQKLGQEERRLRRQTKHPLESPQEQERRLQRQQETIDRIRRQHEREKAAQQELDRLRRLIKNSRSDNHRSGNDRQQSQRAMSRGLGDATRKSARIRRSRSTRDALDETRRFIRRIGSQKNSHDRRQQQKQRFSRAAQGNPRSQSRPATMLIEGEVADGGRRHGASHTEGQEHEPRQGQSQGQGQGQDHDLRGAEADDIDVHHRSRRARADAGKGATRAQVIETASQEGFARESYKRVYTDYRSFAQSAMDSETMPSDQRLQIRRYFQMIQPRG